MKVCFPLKNDNGMESEIYNHFGSAPLFMLIDTDTNELSIVNNMNQHHAHGACNPLLAIAGHSVDAVIVGGIGRGALKRLNNAGIRVFHAQSERVRENVELLKSGSLPEVLPQHTCGGHEHGAGCIH